MSISRNFLQLKIDEEILLYYRDASKYPKDIYEELLDRWSDDSFFSEDHRYELLNILISDLKSKKILDMSSGCGSFVLQGLLKGYQTYGVEPEDWKHELIDLKFQENDYSEKWRSRLKKGIGEKLPFPDEYFDVFDSWQTFEHVGNEQECIFELYRVVKKNGQGVIRCPDYLSFFEAHYRILWFPLMGDSRFARLYLKLRNRPIGGLGTFHPVNRFRLKKYSKKAGFKVVNIRKKQIYDAVNRRIPIFRKSIFIPVLWGVYITLGVYRGLKNFGKGGATISFLLIKN